MPVPPYSRSQRQRCLQWQGEGELAVAAMLGIRADPATAEDGCPSAAWMQSLVGSYMHQIES